MSDERHGPENGPEDGPKDGPKKRSAKRARNRAAASDADRLAVAPRSGLCGHCRHLEVLRTKTSTFVRCGRADWDERLTRYPPLPRFTCIGFDAVETAPDEPS